MSTSVAERDVSDDTGGGRLPMGAVVAVGSVGVLPPRAIGCSKDGVEMQHRSRILVCQVPLRTRSSRMLRKLPMPAGAS